MEINKIIEDVIKEYHNDILTNEDWYHGSPDARDIVANNGFNDNNKLSVEYVSNLNEYNKLRNELNIAHNNNDMETYHNLLDQVPKYKKIYTFTKPVFLTNVQSVARTYADPQRSFDYQNAEEKVFKVDIDCNNTATIEAIGDRFRFISIDKVKAGFIKSGIPENEIDSLIKMFNYYTDKGIKTDVIAAIGSWLEFDCIDVVGVLDSYHGGNVRSTVKIVLNPSHIKLK